MKSQFDIFHEQNPYVYTYFVLYAKDAKVRGVTKIRADEVLHRARWDIILYRELEDREIALNELQIVYANQYGMKLIAEDESFKGFFDLTVRRN